VNPRKVLAIATCLAVPAAGCGSRARLSKAQYEQKVTDIGSRFTDTSMQKIQQALDDLKARGYHIGSPTASP
jgi:hypothetical protein